jgi:hypothetical protein
MYGKSWGGFNGLQVGGQVFACLLTGACSAHMDRQTYSPIGRVSTPP